MSEQFDHQFDLDFSGVTRIELPVTGPDGKKYTLREATGDQAAKFTNARMDRITLGPQGRAQKISGMGDLEPFLVAMCLVGEHERPIQESVIRSWPAKVQTKLFEAAKKISGLDEETGEKLLLERALKLSNAPIRLATLHEWAKSLGEDYNPLKRFLTPSAGEDAKNEQSDSTDGSD